VSRRQAQRQRDGRRQADRAARAPAPASAGDGGRGGVGRWLTPSVLVPLVALFAAATIGLGVAMAFRDDGGKTFNVTYTGCDQANDPNCKARGPTHEHADFVLYINGQQFDFSRSEFVSHGSDELSPIVHIHPERYTVVHIHQTGTTWDEFFRSIGFDLKDPSILGIEAAQTTLKMPDGTIQRVEGDRKFRFIVNGVKVDGITFSEIHDLDRVLIAYGSETDEQAAQLFAKVTDQACISSERCKDRIPPNEPKEECQGGRGTGCVKPGG